MQIAGKSHTVPMVMDRRQFYQYVKRAETADQDVSFTLQINPPQEGTPDGQHDLEQWFFVHGGRVRFVVDGEEVVAGPGDLVYVPRNAVHRHEELGDEPVELLVINHWPVDTEDQLGWE